MTRMPKHCENRPSILLDKAISMMRDGQKDADKLNGSYLSNFKFYDR